MQQQERHPEGHRVGDVAELKTLQYPGGPQQSQIKEKEGKEGTKKKAEDGRRRPVLTANAPTRGGTTSSSTWSRTEDGRTPNASHNCSSKEQHPKELQITQTEAVKRKTA